MYRINFTRFAFFNVNISVIFWSTLYWSDGFHCANALQLYRIFLINVYFYQKLQVEVGYRFVLPNTVCNLLYNAFIFQFAMVEAIISAIADEFPRVMRPHKTKLTFAVCLALFLLGLPIVTYVSSREKGRYLTQSDDKSPIQHEIQKSKATTQKRHQNIRLHNDCGAINDGQLSYWQQPNWFALV